MAFSVSVTGTADLYTLRQRMAAAGQQGLGKPMARALARAAEPVKTAIRAEAVAAMPSGYGPTLSRSLKFRQTAQGSGTTARITLRVYGQGQARRRHIPDLDRGRLRHTRWGDRRHWYTQRVRPGFVSRPADRLLPAAGVEMQQVIDAVARQIGA